jgi:hypothetical protein
MIERTLRGEMGKKGLELGLIKEGDAEEFARAWQRWMESEDATHGSINGQIIIHKVTNLVTK